MFFPYPSAQSPLIAFYTQLHSRALFECSVQIASGILLALFLSDLSSLSYYSSYLCQLSSIPIFVVFSELIGEVEIMGCGQVKGVSFRLVGAGS